MDSGIHKYASHLKKAENNVYNIKLFPENFRVLTSVITTNPKEYVFTTKYKLKNRKGEVLNLTEKYIYIHCTPVHFPPISLGFAYDITDIQSVRKILHTVSILIKKPGLQMEFNPQNYLLV